MSRKFVSGAVSTWLAPLVLAFIGLPTAWADGDGLFGFGLFSGGCDCCQHTHCPPPFKWCQEKPPCICIHRGCARPVCNPCELQHFGYYETCWSPWPFPPDWSHCTVPPYAAHVPSCCPQAGVLPGTPGTLGGVPPVNPNYQLPTPRKIGSGL